MKRFTSILIVGVAFRAGSSQPASKPAGAAPKAAIEPWGFDLKAMDRSIQPGDDFYRYAGGAWMKSAPVIRARNS